MSPVRQNGLSSSPSRWNGIRKRCINFPDFSWRRSHGYLVTCTSRVRKIKRLTVDASNIVADRRRCLPRQIVAMIKRCTFDRPKFHDRSKLIFLRRRTTCGVEKPVYRSTLRLFSSLPMFFLYNLANLLSFLRCRPCGNDCSCPTFIVNSTYLNAVQMVSANGSDQ